MILRTNSNARLTASNDDGGNTATAAAADLQLVSAHGEPEERNARVPLHSADRSVRSRELSHPRYASVWDAELLGELLDRQELRPIIAKSLVHFGDYLVRRGDDLILDSARLGEASSIAHSAFMLLALLHAPPLRNSSGTQKIKGLADGILSQQRTDGSYKVCFEDVPDHGEELYAGETMLALLETYCRLHDTRYL